MLALDPALEAFVIHRSPRFVSIPIKDAPSSLVAAVVARRIMRAVVVADGHDSDTIWSGPSANAHFRAWHDQLHIALDAPFTLEGETRVAEQHRFEVANAVGAHAAHVIFAESFGQSLYFARHGAFPVRQRAFVVACIFDGIQSTVARGAFH